MYSTQEHQVDPLHPDDQVMQDAASHIIRGEVVAFPTETVYGLGADATNEKAIEGIYKAKQRPADNPLIAHFANIEAIKPYVRELPDLAIRLADRFWPGPLTMVLKKTDKIADNVTQGLDTVAVRIPAHPVALSLIEKAGVPIAAPSANLSGRPSPTKAKHVYEDLKGRIPLIINGGSTAIGVESTVINLTSTPPVLLRPGGITVEELQEFIPDLVIPEIHEAETPLSPGMKYKHYSPDTELLLIPNGFEITTSKIDKYSESIKKKSLILCTNSDHQHAQPHLLLGESLKEVQVNLFASLRILDDREYEVGLFEGVNQSFQGRTIMNRMEKAAHRIAEI